MSSESSDGEARTADLYLVRHGETDGESSIRYHGRSDVALSDLGRRQMRAVARALREVPFAAAVSSTLARSSEGLNLVLDGATCAVMRVEDLAEIHFGDWEGKTAEEIQRHDPGRFDLWRSRSEGFSFPGGESREEFCARVAGAARRVFDPLPAPAAAVLHKGVIKVVLGELLRLPDGPLPNLPVELGSIHRLARSGGGWRLIAVNETGHLGSLRLPDS